MNKEEKILMEVEKTLNVIDELPNLEANPFLFTRIKARIEKEHIRHGGTVKTDFVLKPVTLALILVINIITAVYFIGSGSSNVSGASIVDTMKQEYGVTQIQSDNYNLE
ncbi:MAG: hypothetical protein HYZ10_14385 [Ignavibacteriales bacterium]|nr:hypothetical protein [Ignavibacteriales bacterium]